MKPLVDFRGPRRSGGNSAVELALVLPMLLYLVIGVIDFGRAIHFNNVLVALSREGGNLAARTGITPHNIINALTDHNNIETTLDMPVNGMVYITTVKGRSDGKGTVQDQTRAFPDGNTNLASRLNGFTCGSWNGEQCQLQNPKPVIAFLNPMVLEDGEIVHVVETIYNYDPVAGPFNLSIFGLGPVPLMQTSTQLYSQTIL